MCWKPRSTRSYLRGRGVYWITNRCSWSRHWCIIGSAEQLELRAPRKSAWDHRARIWFNSFSSSSNVTRWVFNWKSYKTGTRIRICPKERRMRYHLLNRASHVTPSSRQVLTWDVKTRTIPNTCVFMWFSQITLCCCAMRITSQCLIAQLILGLVKLMEIFKSDFPIVYRVSGLMITQPNPRRSQS